MSALSDLLGNANTRGLSARSIARTAQDAGFSLNHDTAARYLRGDHGRPDEQTLLALSKVLKVPLSQLRSAASLPAEETEPYRPPVEASRLNRRQRRAVDEVIRAMLETRSSQPSAPQAVTGSPRRAGRKASSAEPAKRAAEPVKRTSRAARRGSVEPPTR